MTRKIDVASQLDHACQATLADVCEFLEANHLPLAAGDSVKISINTWRLLNV